MIQVWFTTTQSWDQYKPGNLYRVQTEYVEVLTTEEAFRQYPVNWPDQKTAYVGPDQHIVLSYSMRAIGEIWLEDPRPSFKEGA